MERIHWSGGVSLPGKKMLKGWPACCSGDRAYAIRAEGMMNSVDPSAVTCKRCRALMVKGNLIKRDRRG